MLKSYLTIAYRNFKRNKGYTFINVVGLAIGIAVSLTIALYVQHELSYDDFHENAGRLLYRLTHAHTLGDEESLSAGFPAPMGPTLARSLPEVRQIVRFQMLSSPVLIARGEKQFYEPGILYADSNFFDVFSFQLLKGNPETALSRPYMMVLTEQLAKKYFGEENPLGKTLTIGNKDTYEVTGVVEDPPSTSTIQFDLLASFATVYEQRQYMMVEYKGGWRMSSFPTYLLLAPDASAEAVEGFIPQLLSSEPVSEDFLQSDFQLEPLPEVYFSQVENPLGPQSDISYMYMFSTVALLILLVASINYVNLATARSAQRAREVGVRKAAGAERGHLRKQFLIESGLLSAVALLLALGLIWLTLPVVEQLTGTALNTGELLDPTLVAALIGMMLLLSLLSGAYPAFVLSRFKPVEVLRGKLRSDAGGARLRKSLVVFQFAVSAVLLISAAVVWQQLSYLRHTELGLATEHVVIIPTQGALSPEDAQTFKNELLQNASIIQATISQNVPTKGAAQRTVQAEGHNEPVTLVHYGVDADYMETLGIELKAGRGLSAERPSDRKEALLLNEAAVDKLNWQDPVGKTITYNNRTRTVVGVVENFNFESLHHAVKPIFMVFNGGWVSYVTAELRTDTSPIHSIESRRSGTSSRQPIHSTISS